MKRLFAFLLLIAAILLVGTGLVLVGTVPMSGLLFLGIGLAVGGLAIWLDYGRSRAEKARDQADLLAARTAGRFEANIRQRGVLLLCGFFVLVSSIGIYGGWSERNDTLVLSSAVLLALFGYFGWHLLRITRQPGPSFLLDVCGLHHVQYGTMPWQDIVGISLRQHAVKGTTISVLIVGVRQPHRFVAGLPWFARWRYRNWGPDRPAIGDVEIPITNLDRKPEIAFAAAQAMLKRYNPEAPILWHSGMSPRDLETFQQLERLTRRLETASASEQPTEAEMAALNAQLEQLAPDLDQATRRVHDHARKLRNQNRLSLLVGGVLLLLWVASKFL